MIKLFTFALLDMQVRTEQNKMRSILGPDLMQDISGLAQDGPVSLSMGCMIQCTQLCGVLLLPHSCGPLQHLCTCDIALRLQCDGHFSQVLHPNAELQVPHHVHTCSFKRVQVASSLSRLQQDRSSSLPRQYSFTCAQQAHVRSHQDGLVQGCHA